MELMGGNSGMKGKSELFEARALFCTMKSSRQVVPISFWEAEKGQSLLDLNGKL